MASHTPRGRVPSRPLHHRPAVRRSAGAAAAAGLLTAGLWTAAPAQAHDQLLSAEPASGETLKSAPEELLLTFSGNLITGQGIQNLVRVTDDQGHQWQDGEAAVSGPTLSTQLCEGMPNGEYEVAFRVVYSDGHSEELDYSFSVDDPSGPDTGAPSDGCGVTAAQPQQERGTTRAPSDDESTAPAAEPTSSGADGTVVEDGTAQDEPGLPAWVWAVGFGGVAVVVLGLVVAARKAKSLG